MAQKKRFITDEELQIMQKLYQKCDQNGDGVVPVAELEKAFAEIQDPRLKEIAQHSVPDLDRDGNGNVSFKEFLNAIQKSAKDLTEHPPPKKEEPKPQPKEEPKSRKSSSSSHKKVKDKKINCGCCIIRIKKIKKKK